MGRLKNSILKKSKLIMKSDNLIAKSKETKLKKIYTVVLRLRGGRIEHFQADTELPAEMYKLVDGIKALFERLAIFLKRLELRRIARIFFKNKNEFLNYIKI